MGSLSENPAGPRTSYIRIYMAQKENQIKIEMNIFRQENI